MKRATLLVPLLAVALALPVFAQAERDVKTGGTGKEETLKLMINGGLDVAFAYDSAELRETARWENGGFGPNNGPVKEPYYYFNGPAWIQFWASLQDNVEMNITIRTVPFTNDQGGVQAAAGNNPITDRRNWGDDLNGTIVVKYATMRIKELFNPNLSLTVGQMDVIWDVRGRGNAIFLDVAHAESPWADVARAWATTVRTEEYPVGFKVNYSVDSLSFELGLFPVVHEASTLGLGVTNGSKQQGVYYVNGIFNIDNQGSKLGAILAAFHGINPSDNVITAGFSGVFVPHKDVELFAEGYVQFGQAWTKVPAGGGGRAPLGGVPAAFASDGEQKAYSFLLGARLDVPGDMGMFFQLDILYASGQDQKNGAAFSNVDGFATGTNTNRTSSEFMSYENYDVMLLLNSNEWGYDFDNNILQVTLQGGLMLSTGGSMKNNLHLILKLASASAPEKWTTAAVANVHPAESKDLYGFEVDFTARWYMNKNANIYWSVGYLADSDIVKMFNRAQDDFAWVTLLGVQVSH